MLELLVTLSQKSEVSLYKKATGFILGNDDTAVRITHSFSFDEMQEIANIIHSQKKKIYLNFSRLFMEREMESLRQNFVKMLNIQFDGILFSDFALVTLAKEYGVVDRLIYASETQIVNYFDLNVLHKQEIQKAIVSKEMTYDNVLLTAEKTQSKIGLYVFGHYAMFYSKRKLISNFAQEYALEDFDYLSKLNLTIQENTRQEKLPIIQNENGTTIFSHDILCAVEEAFALKKAGIHYFIFDSLFIQSKITNAVLDMFYANVYLEQTIDRNTLQNTLNIENLSTGFLYKQIGLK